MGQYTPPEGADFSAEACPLPLGEQQPADAHTRTALLDPAKLDAVRQYVRPRGSLTRTLSALAT